jgi:predicted phosphodiesterase
MRIAVLSDIHANLHALEATLAAAADESVDAVWCLGDTVGYGPKPNECCALVRDRAELCLAGNHDLAVAGSLPVDAFNGDAGAAVRWTQSVLDDDARAFLAGLAPSAKRPGVGLFHGSPLDPVWDYVLTEASAYLSFRATDAPLLLVGHSHVTIALSFDGRELRGGIAPAETELELGGDRWLLNPGSVGQPRGGDPRACWLLIDQAAGRATFHRADYPVARTQAEMHEQGLPAGLAARLARGL